MSDYPSINFNPYNMYNDWSYNYNYSAFRGVQNSSTPFDSQSNVNLQNPTDTMSFRATEHIKTKQKNDSYWWESCIGAVVATSLAFGADFLFCKGKHVKNLWGKLKGNKTKPDVKPEVKQDVKPEVKQDVKPEIKQEVKPEIQVYKDPNIPYKEADGVKDFADRYNLTLRCRDYNLRHGINLPDNEKFRQLNTQVEQIDKIFKKATPLDKEYVVYRGLDIPPAGQNNPIFSEYKKLMENAKIGDVITPDAGYSFVGLRSNNIGDYCASGIMEIRLPKGTQFVIRNEWEAMMPRNAQYKVIDKTIGNDSRIKYVLEYILPKV